MRLRVVLLFLLAASACRQEAPPRAASSERPPAATGPAAPSTAPPATTTEISPPPLEEQRDPTQSNNPEEPSVDEAATVLRDYYAAINGKDYAAAYRFWSGEGSASGKSLEQFRDGFRGTARSDVTPGTPGSVGAAAGSRYVEIPVHISAKSTDGTKRDYQGTYVLRRAVVDGATAEQRAWRIGSASIHAVSP